MGRTPKRYLPAAGQDWALPLYDPFVRLAGIHKALRALAGQAALQRSHRVLDIGCGTGTLAVLIRRLHPDVDVTGLDPDPKALGRAERKARRAGVSVRFDRGFSQDLPYPDQSFDRVFSSFMFHHLDAQTKGETLCAVRRVLKPEGSFHLLDFGGEDAHAHGWLAQLFHSSERLRDNSDSRILSLMNESGLRNAKKVGNGSVFLGLLRLSCYEASL